MVGTLIKAEIDEDEIDGVFICDIKDVIMSEGETQYLVYVFPPDKLEDMFLDPDEIHDWDREALEDLFDEVINVLKNKNAFIISASQILKFEA